MKIELAVEVTDEAIAQFLHAAAVEVARELASTQTTQSPWMNVDDVAEYTRFTSQAIRDAEKRGHLRAHRARNGRLRFRVEDVEAFLRGEAP